MTDPKHDPESDTLKPPPPISEPAPEVKSAQAALDLAFPRQLEAMRGLLDEDRAKLIEKFGADLKLVVEGFKTMVRRVRDDFAAKRITDQVDDLEVAEQHAVRLLVVDDSDALRMSLSRLFERHGMEVCDASGPAEAMNRLDLIQIDVVLIDLRMPKNGEMLFEYVRRAHPGCEVVIMTGAEEDEAAQHAMRRGAFAVLIKPFTSIFNTVLTISKACEHGRLRRHPPPKPASV